jgi:hypothetical protein
MVGETTTTGSDNDSALSTPLLSSMTNLDNADAAVVSILLFLTATGPPLTKKIIMHQQQQHNTEVSSSSNVASTIVASAPVQSGTADERTGGMVEEWEVFGGRSDDAADHVAAGHCPEAPRFATAATPVESASSNNKEEEEDDDDEEKKKIKKSQPPALWPRPIRTSGS